MTIQITGKNLDVGEALRTYATDRLSDALKKYVGRTEFPGHVRIEKERGRFLTHCSVQLWSGISLQSQGAAVDPYASVDMALDRLEKRMRRHMRRLKNHHNGQPVSFPEAAAMDYVVQPGEPEEAEASSEQNGEDGPIIIAETRTVIRELSVSDAVMHMDLSNAPFLLFRNAAHGQINVVYRREDGNIGWIDPSQSVR